jgi:hypothetical protein
MRNVALAAVLAMIGLLAALLVVDVVRYGIQALDVAGLLVLALFGFGIVGALRHPPPGE